MFSRPEGGVSITRGRDTPRVSFTSTVDDEFMKRLAHTSHPQVWNLVSNTFDNALYPVTATLSPLSPLPSPFYPATACRRV